MTVTDANHKIGLNHFITIPFHSNIRACHTSILMSPESNVCVKQNALPKLCLATEELWILHVYTPILQTTNFPTILLLR